MTRASVALTVLCLVLPAGLEAQAVLLRLDPEVGVELRYRGEMETRLVGGPAGTGDEPFMIGTFFSTQRVIAADGDARTYEVVTDSMRFETPGMPGLSDVMGQQALEGVTQTLSFDTRGQMLDLEPPPGLDPQAQQALEGFQGLTGMGMNLPEGRVSPGHTWTATAVTDLPLGPSGSGGMRIEMTYVLDRVSGGVAHISVSGPVTMEMSDGAQALDASGTISGSMSLDLERGVMTSNDMTTQIDLNAQGMSINMTQIMRMRLI